MEKQRSFTIKSRYLFFIFSISSSVLFMSFFSIWIFHEPTLIPLEISLNVDLKPIKVQTLTSSSITHIRKTHNFSLNKSKTENYVLKSTHYRKFLHNSSVEVQVSEGLRIEEKNRSESKVMNHTMRSQNQSKSDNSYLKLKVGEFEEKRRNECDISKGKWVFDESYPLYKSSSCPFIDEGFNCEANGRLNTNYTKWRWQPHNCNIPRFNAVKMLELIRGKRLVFVGDSINRNQWESMLCLLRGAIKDPKRVYETHGRKITKEKGNYSFKFEDYECTVEYYVSHFLVHESKAKLGHKRIPTLRIDTLDRSSSRWKDADILVFNSAHWWSHSKTQSGVNYYQERNQVHPHLDVSAAFRRALMTWATWVDKHIKPDKTQVFFRSSSPPHFRGGEWNAGGHCKEADQPLNETTNILYPRKNIIVEEVINEMKTHVTLLNITSLTEFRIDGHPSVYGKTLGKGPLSGYQDCSHWCLPGVPDTWNELLYFHLQSKQNSVV